MRATFPFDAVQYKSFFAALQVQSSSCVLFYLQCGLNTPAACAVVELFFSLVRAQLDHAMKHVVQLGYVVCSDVRKVNGTLGFRVVVESQYPLSFVVDTVESALDGPSRGPPAQKLNKLE